MKLKRYIKLLILTITTLLILSALPVLAADGDGSGSGNGEGVNAGESFTLLSSSIKENDSNVVINPTIELEFEKNIVNTIVIENNSKCFHLLDNSGKPVKIKLLFPDDQMDRTYKDFVFITPIEDLKANTVYTLVVDKSLTAKNGTELKDTANIKFITGKNKSNTQNEKIQYLGQNIIEYENALEVTNEPTETTENVVYTTQKHINAETVNGNNISRIVIVAACVFLVLFAIAIILINKKSKKEDQTKE